MFYFFRLTLVLVITIVLATVIILLGLFDPHGKRVYLINQFWTWLILRIAGISLKIRGLENIDPGQQYIFMVNHQSNIDIPVVVQSLANFQLRWIAKKELLWVPLFGWAMWATKHITVDRSDRTDAVKSLERAKQRIAAGISVVVFPEGTRSRDGKLSRFVDFAPLRQDLGDLAAIHGCQRRTATSANDRARGRGSASGRDRVPLLLERDEVRIVRSQRPLRIGDRGIGLSKLAGHGIASATHRDRRRAGLRGR